eukprot:5130164-Pyramimonas_sp.AAC.1
METYSVHDYAEPGYTNPNAKSLALWEGGSVNGFVLYAVRFISRALSCCSMEQTVLRLLPIHCSCHLVFMWHPIAGGKQAVTWDGTVRRRNAS